MNPKKARALKDLGEIHPQEIELLWLIRNKYRFGSIEIQVRDGVPQDIIQTVRRERLSHN